MRLTFKTLRSGQPGPYQDTERVCQLRIEEVLREPTEGYLWVPYGTGFLDRAKADPTLAPETTPDGWFKLDLSEFQPYLKLFSPWSFDQARSDWEHAFDSYLDYARQVGPGLIEWRVVSRFTD